VALGVEGVVDRSMGGHKALGRSGRLEALHLALAPACRLMRVLGPVVLAQTLLVASQKTELPLGGSV